MAKTPSTSDNSCNAIPESTYRKHVLRARSTNNHFVFNRDWVPIFGRDRALFLQDIINRASCPNTARRVVMCDDGVEREFFLCTRKYLRESQLSWSDEIQKAHLKSLKDGGFVLSISLGIPAKRWLWIDVLKIEETLDRYEESTGTPPTKGGEKSTTNPVGKSTTNPVGKSTVNKVTHNKKGHTKESTHTPSQAREGVPHREIPYIDGNIPVTKYQRWTRLLWEKVDKEGLLNHRRSHRRDWEKEFIRLQTVGPREGPIPTDEEVDHYLSRFLPEISVSMKNRYCPVVHSAKSLVDKWHQVVQYVDRMNRDGLRDNDPDSRLNYDTLSW